MNAEASNIEYSRNQLEEARRRLNSVRERVTETRESSVMVAIDKRNDEIVSGDEKEDVPDEDLEYRTLKTELEEVSGIDGHIQNIIIDCQMSIELSVKAMFKAVGQDFDQSHGITFSSHNTQGFNSKVPDDFPRKEEIIRTIFLTQLWEQFYEFAKYGAPELNVGPSVIFDIKDGQRAINDASLCVALAEDLIDYVDD